MDCDRVLSPRVRKTARRVCASHHADFHAICITSHRGPAVSAKNLQVPRVVTPHTWKPTSHPRRRILRGGGIEGPPQPSITLCSIAYCMPNSVGAVVSTSKARCAPRTRVLHVPMGLGVTGRILACAPRLRRVVRPSIAPGPVSSPEPVIRTVGPTALRRANPSRTKARATIQCT